MPLMLALLAPALAVPKAFSDQVVLLAVAPDAHHVLLGTLGSFADRPHGIVERDVRTGATREASPAVVEALASCEFDAPCPALDAAWRSGAWIAWSAHPAPAAWTLTAREGERWTTTLAATCAEEGTVYLPCEAARGADSVALLARDGAVQVTLHVGDAERSARFSAARLHRLGVPDPQAGVVVWGTEGVLVAWAGAWADEGQAEVPLMAFVLPTR